LVFESLVRNGSTFLGDLCGLDEHDAKRDDGGGLEIGVQGLGNLLGLCSLVGSFAEPVLRVRLCIAVERDTFRVQLGLGEGSGKPLAKVFRGVEEARNDGLVLLGRKDSMKGAPDTDIPLGLGPSCDSPCIPNDVAGLADPVLDKARLCAIEVFGRLRLCSDWGRVLGPMLAENELLEVFLDAEELDRDRTEEEEDAFRVGPVFAIALTAELTVVEEGGAGRIFLIGSAAFSTSVLLFGAGSGTANRVSE
jgi:hypothetical protein